MSDQYYQPNLEESLITDWRYPVYELVQGQLFHSTTCRGLRGILATRKIKPNDGTFPFTFPQSQESYGFRHHYLSLFDFEETTPAEQIRTFHIWDNFVGRFGKAVFLLVLCSSELRPRLISSRFAPHPGQKGHGTCMRPIEVWYPGSIDLDRLDFVVAIRRTNDESSISVCDVDSLVVGIDRFCPEDRPAVMALIQNAEQ